MVKKSVTKVPYAEFVTNAIVELRKPPYKGIHVVYSGFNELFKGYYGENPREIVDQLAKDGVVVIMPAKRGAMLYLPGEAPQRNVAEGALERILAQSKGKKRV